MEQQKAKFIRYVIDYYKKEITGAIYQYRNKYYTFDYYNTYFLESKAQQHKRLQKEIDEQIERERIEASKPIPTAEEQKEITAKIQKEIDEALNLIYSYTGETEKWQTQEPN